MELYDFLSRQSRNSSISWYEIDLLNKKQGKKIQVMVANKTVKKQILIRFKS